MNSKKIEKAPNRADQSPFFVHGVLEYVVRKLMMPFRRKVDEKK